MTDEILYVGNDQDVLDLLKDKKYVNIKDFDSAMNYSRSAPDVFEILGDLDLSDLDSDDLDTIKDLGFPGLVLSDLHIPTSKTNSRPGPYGIPVVMNINALYGERAYLITKNSPYLSQETVESICREKNIPYIRKSQLEEKLKELTGDTK